MGMLFARDYVVQFATNVVDHDVLERAIALLPEENEKQALLLIQNKQDLSQAVQFLSLIDNKTEQCSLTMSLLLYAKLDGQQAASAHLESYFFSLSSEFCATEFAFLQQMQGSGGWETMGSKAIEP